MSLEDKFSDCVLDESYPDTILKMDIPKRNEDQTVDIVETKEYCQSSSDGSMNSSEVWNWRNRNDPKRNKDKENSNSTNGFRKNSSSSSDQPNWRCKKEEQTVDTVETKEHCQSSSDVSMNSSEGWNWRNKNDPKRNKDKENSNSTNGFRKNSSSSSDQPNWRCKKDIRRNIDKENSNSTNRFRKNSSSSSDQPNWRCKKEEQTVDTVEIKEHCQSSSDVSMNSSEGWNWRNKNDTKQISNRNKVKEIARPIISFPDQCSWRNKKGLGADEMYLSAENQLNSKKGFLYEDEQRIRGFWCLKCDSGRSSENNLSEADMIWSAVTDLYKENQEFFQFPPSKNNFAKGYTLIRCYTPEFQDLDVILKAALLIREHINFPYTIHYFRTNNTQNIYMHVHSGELYKKVKKEWKLIEKN
ncbi:uncharacterized protein DDB_G0287625-like [Argiope bruennichi]|uniref:uncharacterized protein DDB_G0287625-like n=1 Tax=Argiope bruennichi TaxID=94029 RepID=UPI00249565B6|nr:uncharacterized protein DDB_G0287625-like [Argiope bruennichi]